MILYLHFSYLHLCLCQEILSRPCSTTTTWLNLTWSELYSLQLLLQASQSNISIIFKTLIRLVPHRGWAIIGSNVWHKLIITDICTQYHNLLCVHYDSYHINHGICLLKPLIRFLSSNSVWSHVLQKFCFCWWSLVNKCFVIKKKISHQFQHPDVLLVAQEHLSKSGKMKSSESK